MTKRRFNPENEMPMPNDYLWDRSGTRDPEIQQLESLLAEFRHTANFVAPPFPEPPGACSPAFEQVSAARFSRQPWLARLAAAAIILLALVTGFLACFRPATQRAIGPAWNVANLQGAPQIGSQSISPGSSAKKLYVGQTLSTDSSSRVALSDNDLGEIQIDPNSRVRLLQIDPDHKRLQLQLGTIHASIWAPPGQFVVDTPSAIAVDLGCAYTLHIAPDGSGTIRTTLGWVGFHLNGRDSFIPAGAMCSTRPNVGPGTPYFEDATQSFRDALHAFDLATQSSSSTAALSIVLTEARPRDALTLWHLLDRTAGPDRAKVYATLARFVPPPPGTTREGILALNPHMLDLYWNALDLGDISLWRLFEQNSSPGPAPATKQMLLKKQSLLQQAP
jgi:hypothetical protein